VCLKKDEGESIIDDMQFWIERREKYRDQRIVETRTRWFGSRKVD